MQSVAADFIVQDVDTQLHIRFLHLGNQTTREAREQTLVHAFEVDRRTVAGQNDALTIAKEMIKDVEKGAEKAVDKTVEGAKDLAGKVTGMFKK